MNINDKIKQILIDKNLTPSYFADEIGVQRSSISHILSGRNRPSFDIIQKIIRRFPELGYEWIMEEESFNNYPSTPSGSGYAQRSLTRPAVDRPERTVDRQAPTFSSTYSTAPSAGVRTQRNEIPPVPLPAITSLEPAPADSASSPSSIEKKVERILIFYTDGSFREYTPTN